MTHPRLDELDLQIIRCLQDDPRAPYATISRIVGASESTVKRRHEALLEARIIFPATMLDPSVLGYGSTANLLLKVEPRHTMAVAEHLCSLGEIGYVILTLGHYDILAYVIQPTVADISTFITEQVAPLPGVQSIETILTPKFLKVFAGWRIPPEGLSALRAVTGVTTPIPPRQPADNGTT